MQHTDVTNTCRPSRVYRQQRRRRHGLPGAAAAGAARAARDAAGAGCDRAGRADARIHRLLRSALNRARSARLHFLSMTYHLLFDVQDMLPRACICNVLRSPPSILYTPAQASQLHPHGCLQGACAISHRQLLNLDRPIVRPTHRTACSYNCFTQDIYMHLLCVQTCGQVLITAESFASSSQYALAKQTFAELLRLGAVPVVNENVRSTLLVHFALLPSLRRCNPALSRTNRPCAEAILTDVQCAAQAQA